jgi:CRP-like cAMP-binding protein
MTCQHCVAFSDPNGRSDLGLNAEGCLLAEHKIYRSGEVIYAQNKESNGIYCIREGEVMITKVVTANMDIPIAFAHQPEIIGASSMMSGYYINSAEAISKVEVCFIPKARLLMPDGRFMPNIRGIIMQQMMLDIGSAEDKLIMCANQTNTERLYHFLISLASHLGVADTGFIPLDLPIQKLAQWMGCTPRSLEKNLEMLIDRRQLARDVNNLSRYQILPIGTITNPGP